MPAWQLCTTAKRLAGNSRFFCPVANSQAGWQLVFQYFSNIKTPGPDHAYSFISVYLTGLYYQINA